MATRSIGEYMTHGIRGTGIDPTVMAGMTHGIRGAGDGESIRHGTMAGTTHVGRGAGVILTMHGTVTVGVVVGTTVGVVVGTTVGQDHIPMAADSQPDIVAVSAECLLKVRRRSPVVARVMHRRFVAVV